MGEDKTNQANTGQNKVKADSGGMAKTLPPSFFRFITLFRVVERREAQALIWLINFIVPAILSIILGISPIPTSIPFVDAIKMHPIISLEVSGVLTLITALSLFASRVPMPSYYAMGQNSSTVAAKDGKIPDQTPKIRIRPLQIVTGLSIISTMVCLALLLMVLVRPTWCPTSLCPGPQIIVNPNGIHDGNLEVYFKTFENASTVLTGDVTHYAQNSLPVSSDPKTIGAMRIDEKASPFPYRVVVGVHSLQQGQFGLIIEQVNLVVTQVPLLPNPLNILTEGVTVDYRANPYIVTYSGQGAGARLLATYTPDPIGTVVLSPGEADQLDIQVNSHVLADLQFQIQVTYRVSNESQTHTLTLPFIFQVAFSSQANWHLYQLENGHLMASP